MSLALTPSQPACPGSWAGCESSCPCSCASSDYCSRSHRCAGVGTHQGLTWIFRTGMGLSVLWYLCCFVFLKNASAFWAPGRESVVGDAVCRGSPSPRPLLHLQTTLRLSGLPHPSSRGFPPALALESFTLQKVRRSCHVLHVGPQSP